MSLHSTSLRYRPTDEGDRGVSRCALGLGEIPDLIRGEEPRPRLAVGYVEVDPIAGIGEYQVGAIVGDT